MRGRKHHPPPFPRAHPFGASSNIEDGLGGISNPNNGTINWGDGNIDIDPAFATDYSLLPSSPSLYAGVWQLLPNDEFDIDEDDCTAEAIPLDRNFNPRIIGCNVDQGAFESAFWCPGDLDCDGGVGVPDLLILIGAWGSECGQCESHPDDWHCPADLNGNGSVGVPDLLVLIGNWGICPLSAENPPQDIQDCLDQYDIDQDEGALLDCLDAALEE